MVAKTRSPGSSPGSRAKVEFWAAKLDQPAVTVMYAPGLLAVLVAAFFGLAACTEPERPTVNLYRAVDIGDLDQVKRHLYWGTPIDQPDAEGDLPLHLAARAGRIAIARQMARHGADLDAENAAGLTPIGVALVHGRTQLAEMLIEQGAELEPQRMVDLLIQRGVSDRDTLELLIEQGADLDARNEDGLAPLHRAVGQGRLELTTRLIRAGVDINQLDATGRTALDIAIANDHRDIAKLLRQFGGRVAADDSPDANEKAATGSEGRE